MSEKNGTIFQRLEKKIDSLGEKVQREAEKKIMHQRITEMVRGKSIWEKIELIVKILS